MDLEKASVEDCLESALIDNDMLKNKIEESDQKTWLLRECLIGFNKCPNDGGCTDEDIAHITRQKCRKCWDEWLTENMEK